MPRPHLETRQSITLPQQGSAGAALLDTGTEVLADCKQSVCLCAPGAQLPGEVCKLEASPVMLNGLWPASAKHAFHTSPAGQLPAERHGDAAPAAAGHARE